MIYLFRLALRPWRMAPLSQLFSSFVVGFLVLLCGFLFFLERGLKPVVDRLQGEEVITAWVLPEVPATDEPALLEQVRSVTLKALSERSVRKLDIRFTQSAQFLDGIEKPYPELKRQIEELGGSGSDLVPRYITLSGVFGDRVLAAIRDLKGIEQVETSRNRHAHVVGAYRALRWVVRLLVAGLALALVTGLIHLARMNAHLHRDALSILRLWGAGPWVLRMPALFSGSIVGLIGGLGSFVGWGVGSTWLVKNIRSLSPMLQELRFPGVEAAAGLLVAGVLIGVIAGSAGTWSAGGSDATNSDDSLSDAGLQPGRQK
jgi:hypothetical protein